MGTIIKDGINYSGGSGITSYNALSDKPAINGVSLAGNKSSDDLGIITKAVNDLVNYYLKSETYSKTETDTLIAAVKNSRFEAVSSLPTTNIKTNVIYLVPKSSPETSDVKDEYINLDGTTSGWELIGSTDVDLSGYVSDQELNTALADYTTTANLTTLLNAKQDKVQVSTMPTASADYVGKGFYQFMGVTDSTYTHGYFYECVNNGGTYSWSQVNVQPSSGGGGGGHTIEDSDGTDLTQRDTLQFGEGFVAEDDDTNEKTVILPDVMQSGDMDDVITPLPSVAPKKEGVKYSTTEQVIGEWIDGKPLYQKTYFKENVPANTWTNITTELSNCRVIYIGGIVSQSNDTIRFPIPCRVDNLTISCNQNGADLPIFISNAVSNVYATIQYTKTTDTPNT